LVIPGPAGALEVLRDAPVAGAGSAQRGVAVIAHPHPLYGGTMDNKVVQTLARAFVASGWEAVRFNFRGVGASAGTYDEGRGEREDFLSVVTACAPDGLVALAGFSFGAFVACEAAARLQARRDIAQIVLVGAATGRFSVPALPAELHPQSLVIHGESDDTVPLSEVFAWARPQNLPVTVIPGASHFFHGQLPLLRSLVVRHLRPVV
jgi:alpha/beta superfamily hydrolase